jgi:hypothetical protein
MSHTPGPWKLDTYNGYLLSSDCISILKFDIKKTSIQDAKLIAAAPEMLEELERARSHFVELHNGHHTLLAFEELLVYWIGEIDKVLEKARGQA